MKRKTLACLVCSVLVVGVFALAGCASNSGSGNADQEAISKDLTTQLDSFKSSGSKALADELKANESTFKTLGIDSDEFAKEMMDGFSYSIGTITVKDGAKSATAEVKLTSKTVVSALTALVNNIPSAVTSLSADDISSEDKINKFIGKQLLQAAKSAGTESTTITLTYSKSGDNWKMDDLETQIYKALGLDTIDLNSIYSYLGVSNASELESYINQLLSK